MAADQPPDKTGLTEDFSSRNLSFDTVAEIYRANGIDEPALADLKDCEHVTLDPQAVARLQMKPAFDGKGVLDAVPGRRLYTIYMDMNHSDLRPHEAFFNRRNLDSIIRGGARHVFLERPSESDGLYQSIADGTETAETAVPLLVKTGLGSMMKPEQQEACCRREAEGIAYLGHAGVKVHCVDDRQGGNAIASPDEMAWVHKFFVAMNRFRAENAPGLEQMNTKVWWGAYYLDFLPAAEQQGKLREAMTAFKHFFESAEDDTGLARKIAALANGETSALFYGGRHGLKENDLDNLLGRDQCTRIALFGDIEQYADKWMPEDMLRGAPDQPEFLYFSDSGKAYAGRPLAAELQVIAAPFAGKNDPEFAPGLS